MASTEAMKTLLRLLCRGGPEGEFVERGADDGATDGLGGVSSLSWPQGSMYR